MITARTALARRVTAALDASPSRIPVLLGGCGSGRTTLLQQLRERLGRTSTQYIDVERTATTPERLLHAIAATTPFPISDQARPGARASFDATLEFMTRPPNFSVLSEAPMTATERGLRTRRRRVLTGDMGAGFRASW